MMMEVLTMREGLRSFCGFLVTAALAMAILSSLAAVATNSRAMYIQTAVLGMIGVAAALAMAMRL